ncbi:MAG: hypothetical protein CO118_10255 [Flavobacteriales bacterium CG_4_9_14_3_um_filter_32_8]|nr:MAG: hypothetical protein CO118_10255 [Flavobacteriales bacterium CG_4_9_14_3_um_filter_32_8]
MELSVGAEAIRPSIRQIASLRCTPIAMTINDKLMFKNPFQVAVVFAVISLIVKVSIFLLGVQHGAAEAYIRYFLMLVLLVTVFFGIRSNKVMYEGATTFRQDFKTGARTASFYAILMAIITYVYYAKIDADFFAIKQQPLLDELYNSAKNKMATESRETIQTNLSNQIFGIQTYLSPYFQAMWTLFGLVFMGLFHSAVFAFLMKKYPGFKK